MKNYWDSVEDSAAFLLNKIVEKPVIGLMTGTGLGRSLSSMEVSVTINFNEIPGFPVSTVMGHAGRLLSGQMGGKPVLAMEGRFHLYEGYSAPMVAYPVRVMQAMGIKVLIVMNAAGGLNPDFSPGDIMVIKDHINLTGDNPLIGENDNRWGLRFPDMTQVYTPALIKTAFGAAEENGISLKQGVYLGLKGPSLETPSETRFLKMIGADAVGMSTIQEVIAAIHGGMRVLGLSTITNVNDPDNPTPATVEDIIYVAENAAVNLGTIITAITGKIDL